MAWSSDHKEGYLTKDGINLIRSNLTNDIFKQELLHVYEQKSTSRDELVDEARREMHRLIKTMQSGVCDCPNTEAMMVELAQKLGNVSGKKSYGYLPKADKELVDKIVNQLERLPVVSQCYDRWLELQGKVDAYYTGEARERIPLSEQKEFRSIKNVIIHEAERLRLGEFTFEDESMELEDVPLDDNVAGNIYQYQKEIIVDEAEPLERREKAAREMNELAESGEKYAQYFLGKLCLSGDGTVVIPDAQLARDYFEAAATRGHAPSQYALGKLYLSADYSVRNPARGMEWLKAAANRGNSYAAYRLGKEYLKGEIVRKDVKLTMHYLTESAEQGNSYAQYALGKLYLYDRDVKRDEGLAHYWLSNAAMDGNKYADIMLRRIDARLPVLPVIAVTMVVVGFAAIFCENSAPLEGIADLVLDIKRIRERNEMKAIQKSMRETAQTTVYSRQPYGHIDREEQSQGYGGMGGMSGF